MLKQLTKITTMFMLLIFNQANAGDNITIIAPTSEVADGLDLYAVSEIFKETPNLEEFEMAINDPDQGINNLDLDGNGYVDFIRVVEEIVNGTHIIILQAAIGNDEFQDVATIEVEKSGNDYNMHVHGNEVIYGSNYYIAPSRVHIHTWPIVAWIYRSVYRPYHSVYYWNVYPRWWRSYRPLNRNIYLGRTSRYTNRNTFVVIKKPRVRSVTRIKYKPRNSVIVTKRLGHNKTVVRKNSTTKVKTNTIKSRYSNTGKSSTIKRNGTKTRVKKSNTTKVGVKKTNYSRTGNTTVKRTKKTTNNQYGKKTTVKTGKKTTVNNGKKTTVKKTKKTKKTKDGKKVTKTSKKTVKKNK